MFAVLKLIKAKYLIAGPWVHETQIQLLYPNKARDAHGNVGTWTMIYNEGFEVVINGRSYFAFSAWEQVSRQLTRQTIFIR